MKRILVPVDFSSHTGISCKYALAIAKAAGAEIILFHSFFDQLYFSGGGFNTGGFESGILLTDEILLDFHRQKESRMRELIEELQSEILPSDKPNVKVIYRMGSGDPKIQILQAIEELEPDLITMGSSGMGKKRLLTGSVANHIMNCAGIPVIAVPVMNEVPFISNVLYMTDFNQSDQKVITEIDTILAPFQIRIFCLHLTDDNDSSTARKKMDHIADGLMHESLQGRISFHILDAGSQQEALRVFMDKKDINLIAFIPHKRNLLKNIVFQGLTKKDLFHSHIPILAIKPKQ